MILRDATTREPNPRQPIRQRLTGWGRRTMSHDALIIGAGPAGLTAALYLARYRRKVLVVHDGSSRALRIPLTLNVPGFPDGVAGTDLIARMTRHAETYGARIETGEVVALRRTADGFEAEGADGRRWAARTVLLATGVVLNEPDLPWGEHEQAIRDHVLRYCPICDGFEATGKKLGVLGCDSNGAAEALFLRTWSADVTLMTLNYPELTEDERDQLKAAGVRIKAGALDRLEPGPEAMTVHLKSGETVEVDILYPALGCNARSELGLALGLKPGEAGALDAEAPFGGDVEGVYAAGDVVEGLDQISVAMGHGAVAATRMHNALREKDGQSLDQARPVGAAD